MRNILILTSVVGGGHVFRDTAIASELKKILSGDYEMIFASGGNAFKMLKQEGLKVEEIKSITFNVDFGTINFFKFYLILLWSELQQLFQLRKLLKKYKPDLIILDEFFFLTDYCKTWKIPVVFICDFVGVPRSSFLKNPFQYSLEVFFDWLLYTHLPQKVDKWIYVGDTDHIPKEEWRSRINKNNILPVEPITKLQYSYIPSRDAARDELGFKNDEVIITVTVGCSGTGTYILEAVNSAVPLLRKFLKHLRVHLICGHGILPEELNFLPGKGVCIHGYVKNIEKFYAGSDVLIIQSGITTATECLMAGTPMIAVPITNHWEQEHTAFYLKEKYGTIIVRGEDVSAKTMVDAIGRLLEKENRNMSYFKGNGHKIAAKEIADILTAMRPG